MKEFLYEPLFSIDEANIALINFLLIGIISVAAVFAVKFITKKYGNTLKNQKIVAGGKERNLYRVINQITYFIAILLCIESLSINNDQLGIDALWEHKFLLVDQPKLKIQISLGIIIFNIILFVVARLIFQLSKVFIKNYASDRKWISSHNQYTFITLFKYLIYTLALIICIQSFGADITYILGASAALLVGIGLGLQSFFADIVSGFILLIEGTIKVNDIVEIDKMVAKVEKISIRSSIVKTREGKIIHIPNKKLTSENVVNWTSSDKNTRFSIFVSVPYNTDTEMVKDLLYQSVMKHPKVNKNQNVSILLINFGDKGLDFEIYFWAEKSWEIEFIMSDIRYMIEESLRTNGIKIPLPQRVVHSAGNDKSADY
ncbi:MAG: mechanosensitive ion channel family protein [Bacteroidia bacterium]